MTRRDQLTDYLAGEEDRFFPHSPYDAAERLRRTKASAEYTLSAEVVRAFVHSNPEPSAAVAKNLQRIQSGNIAFVVTGQQVGLFGGPLLTLSKALSAIRVAEALEEETGIPTVPVFWMQTEDHDFKEIATTHFLLHGRKWGDATLRLPESRIGDSVGRIVLSEEAVNDLTLQLQQLGLSAELQEYLLSCYAPGSTLSEAFREVLRPAIDRYGMVFFDPLTEPLVKTKGAFLERSYFDWKAIEECLEKQDRYLSSFGYSQQVSLRKSCPLFSLSLQGQRGRVAFRDGQWVHPAGSLSESELVALFSHAPERLTATALLRPVMQEYFFSAAAVVLGPAEVRYFTQLAPLYDLFGMKVPLVIPRHSMAVVPERVEETLITLSITPADITKTIHEFLSLLVEGLDSDEYFSALLARTIAPLYEERERLLALDKGLEKPFHQTVGSIEKNLEKLRGKYMGAVKRQHEVQVLQFEKAKGVLLPHGTPIERYVNPWSFALSPLVEQMVAQIEPFSKQLQREIRHVQ